MYGDILLVIKPILNGLTQCRRHDIDPNSDYLLYPFVLIVILIWR